MNLLEALREVVRHEVRIDVDGPMAFAAPRKPPDYVITALKEHEARIAALLHSPARPQGYRNDEWIAAIIDAARLGYALEWRQ
jgi:hypothetical protein